MTLKVATELSDELKDMASPTMSAVHTACDLESKDPELAARLAEHAQRMLVLACPHYKPDNADGNKVLCNSGQSNEKPRRGHICAGCPVGQVIRQNGEFVFLGEEVDINSKMMAKIKQETGL
jgi:hypothetical protein